MITLQKNSFAFNENVQPKLQNLLCLCKKKNHVIFLFIISSNFTFSLMNALVYVCIDQGIHKGKGKVTQNEKRKKLHGFSFFINIAH